MIVRMIRGIEVPIFLDSPALILATIVGIEEPEGFRLVTGVAVD